MTKNLTILKSTINENTIIDYNSLWNNLKPFGNILDNVFTDNDFDFDSNKFNSDSNIITNKVLLKDLLIEYTNDYITDYDLDEYEDMFSLQELINFKNMLINL